MATPIAASNIAAQAFRMMELSPLSSFADGSPQARDAGEQYEPALRMSLEVYDWSFERVLVSLPEIAAGSDLVADADLPHSYQLPSDCVKLRLVQPKEAKWRLDGRVLRSDQAGGQLIRYTKLATNEAILPFTFQTAVSAQLAVLLAPKWVRTRSKREKLENYLERQIYKAKQEDGYSASSHRHDGDARHTDWVTEALR